MRVKTLIAASAIALTSVSAATAGGMSEPVVEAPVVVVEENTGSMGSMGGSAPLLIGLGILAVAAAVAANND